VVIIKFFLTLDRCSSVEKKLSKQLSDVTAAQGAMIGSKMTAKLLVNSTPKAGVDEWVRGIPAMQKFDEQMPFFRPFIEKVAIHKWVAKRERERSGAKRECERSEAKRACERSEARMRAKRSENASEAKRACERS
jgi:hypothetical protein